MKKLVVGMMLIIGFVSLSQAEIVLKPVTIIKDKNGTLVPYIEDKKGVLVPEGTLTPVDGNTSNTFVLRRP